MYQDISVQLVSLIYVVILASVYFLKRKYNFLESKIYKSLLVSTIGSLLLDIFSMFLVNKDYVGVKIFSKLYFISLFIWLILFIFYVILNKMNIKYDNFRSLVKQSAICKGWLVISIILFSLLIFSDINYSVNPIAYNGNGVLIVYALGIVGCLFLLVMLLFSSDKVSNYKNSIYT